MNMAAEAVRAEPPPCCVYPEGKIMTGKVGRRLRRLIVGPVKRLLWDAYYHDPSRGLRGDFSAPNRMAALEDLLADAGGRTVLDLGCAEGLIAEGFLGAGANRIDAFDISPGRIANARRLVQSERAHFEVGDVSDWQAFTHRHALLPFYDIVLFLGIYQHLPRRTRAATLYGASARCRRRMAVRAPSELMGEVTEVLVDAGFRATHEIAGNGRGVGRLRLYASEKPLPAVVGPGLPIRDVARVGLDEVAAK